MGTFFVSFLRVTQRSRIACGCIRNSYFCEKGDCQAVMRLPVTFRSEGRETRRWLDGLYTCRVLCSILEAHAGRNILQNNEIGGHAADLYRKLWPLSGQKYAFAFSGASSVRFVFHLRLCFFFRKSVHVAYIYCINTYQLFIPNSESGLSRWTILVILYFTSRSLSM